MLPVAALGFLYLALFLRMMRSGMAEVWRQDFALAARAKGLSRMRIVIRHVARNALLPLVTMLGLQAAAMLGGSVVIESVFAIPGFGRLAQEAVAGRDAPLLIGIIIVSAALVILVNLLVDIAYALLDPRVGAADATGMTVFRRLLRSPEGLAGLAILCLLVLTALLAPVLFPADPLSIVGPALVPPFTDSAFPLGTDRLGRDVLAGLMHGARRLAGGRHRRGRRRDGRRARWSARWRALPAGWSTRR